MEQTEEQRVQSIHDALAELGEDPSPGSAAPLPAEPPETHDSGFSNALNEVRDAMYRMDTDGRSEGEQRRLRTALRLIARMYGIPVSGND